jgi:uncharacterized protein (TIGR03437 family)
MPFRGIRGSGIISAAACVLAAAGLAGAPGDRQYLNALTLRRVLLADPQNAAEQGKTMFAQESVSASLGPRLVTDLTSGAPANFSLTATSLAPQYCRLFPDNAFRIAVPASATKLQIDVQTATSGIDVDLHVRFGQAPQVVSGSIVSDYSATTAGGDEVVIVNQLSSPPLKAGDYYIAINVCNLSTTETRTITATGTVTATITLGGGGGSSTCETMLSAGVAASIPSTTEMRNYCLDVPQNATRLDVVTSTPGVDLFVLGRYDSPPGLDASGNVRFDHMAHLRNAGGVAMIVTSRSTPPIRAGRYYLITLPMDSPARSATGTITAYVNSPPSYSNVPSELSTGFSIEPVSRTTLHNVDYVYRVNVPRGATKLEVRLTSPTSGADLDLYVRFGSVPGGDDSASTTIADFRSARTGTSEESVTITSASSPPLQEGIYYITLGVFSTGLSITGTVSAKAEVPQSTQPPQPPPSGEIPITEASFFDAAGFQKGALAPGTIANIVAAGIATGMQGCTVPASLLGPLPLLLGEVSVQFGNVWAPIFRVCNLNGQESVTVQVPFELSPGRVLATVRRGSSSGSAYVQLRSVSPGLFETEMSDGRRRAVLVRPDNSFVSLENLARPGETLRAYAVGLGALVPAMGTNQPGSSASDGATLYPVIVGVSGAGARTVYARYAANLIGVYEVAFELPLSVPSGNNISFVIASQVSTTDAVFSNSSSIPVR